MVAKHNLLACTAVTALVMLAGPAAHAAASNSELEQRVNNLEQELQNSEIRQGQVNQQVDQKLSAAPAKSSSGWWDNTSISGRMYYDLSWIDAKSFGTKSSSSGYGFDVKRFYIGVDHKFNDVFSGNITTDINYFSSGGTVSSGPNKGDSISVSGGNRIYIYLKKAYLQAKVSDAMTLRIGAADMPWIPFAEGVYGMRYVENTIVDKQGLGNSSDWGVQALGKLAGGHIQYDFAVVDGGGYKHPMHSKSMDFEGRVSANYSNIVLGLGGYVGKLAHDTEGTTTYHTANRIDAIAAYVTKQVHAGVEYFYSEDWKTVTNPTPDQASGYSVFASYQFNPMWGVFGRYDNTKPNKHTDSKLSDEYYNFGLQWSPAKIVDFSLVYKHDDKSDGIAKALGGTDSTSDEVGVFSRFRW